MANATAEKMPKETTRRKAADNAQFERFVGNRAKN
jgi:hypothetical protein